MPDTALRRPLALAASMLAGWVIAGCGGSPPTPSTVPASPAAASPAPAEAGPASQEEHRSVVVATLGDSITAGTPLFDPADPDAGDERSQWQYWAARRNPGATFRNCGVNGEQTHEIARRLQDCARGADILVVQGGINDIARGRPVADAAADLRSMIRRGKALGLRVATVELLPWSNGHPSATPLVDELNSRIDAIARDERVPIYRWHAALEDPAAPGRMRGDLTDDGDHPSIAGHRLLGELVDLPE